MKYVVTLNGKNYEVDVTETKAEIISTTVAPVAAAAPIHRSIPLSSRI